MGTEETSTPGAGDGLTRRERQIMEIIFAEGEAPAKTVMEKMPDPPTYATVRTLLRVLVEKGRLRFRKEGKTYIYQPTRARDEEGQSALVRVMQSFFSGSVEQVMSCLLQDDGDRQLDKEELERLEEMIRQAREQQSKD